MTEIKSGDLCAEVGVSRQRLSQWCHEGLREAAQTRRGWWDKDAALAWIAERRGDAEAAAGGPDLTAQRTRLVAAQADWQELRNRREAGELAYLDDMETATGIQGRGDHRHRHLRNHRCQRRRRRLRRIRLSHRLSYRPDWRLVFRLRRALGKIRRYCRW